MKTPVNSTTLRQHLTYSWWKYALLIVLGALSVNLYFTISSYRSPPEKKIDFYIYGLGDEKALQEYMDSVHQEFFPEMEEMNVLLLATDSIYGPMQLSTYVAAAEGDLYLLPRDEFISFASSGAWVPLEEESELTALFTGWDISLQSGWRREADSGDSHLYGIPVSKLPGLSQYAAVGNGFLCVLVSGGNTENTIRFLKNLCSDMLEE